ncbi:glyoxalase [Henriciella mobilis]|uniref:VOC family protein n=1 Tax=Henriciella mobilis TaxID=2305467 RepID=UPI000E672D53|nr:VOC family protein [Henriciella mobilis]RIJ17850.1 glyoxalase [Henriciella mobilis]RIJ25338.1 glyoxalase [Henriciella mobilis]
MIDALDHIVLVCPEIEAGVAIYSSLLGCEPSWRARADGAATALLSVQNTALELMAPYGAGPVADRLREIIAERGPGLTSLAFRTGDIAGTHHKLARRGLMPDDITDGESTNLGDSSVRRWKRFRCSDEAMAGIKTFILQPESALKIAKPASGAVQSLDHIVINTPNPDRALGLYGAKLGLDLRLDRTAEQWKTRFLFFTTGGLTFEVIHRLGEAHDPDGPDSIWGLTWAVDDLAATHARLSETGLDISDIRTGRKPGSSVFTVRNGTLGVPTLFISHSPR